MDDLMAGLAPVERLRASLPDLPTRGDGREMGVPREPRPMPWPSSAASTPAGSAR
jgi:hypothetical protein